MKFDFHPRSIAILLGLSGALYLAFLPWRDKKHTSSCQSNLKQVGLAMSQYTRDYDEKMMLASNWSDALQPYSKNRALFSCPKTGLGYTYQIYLHGLSLQQIEKPQIMPVFYEPRVATSADGGENWNPNGVHGGGSNVCFFDGHVEWVTTKSAFQTRDLSAELARSAEAGRREALANRLRDEAYRRSILKDRIRYMRRLQKYEARKRKQRAKENLKPMFRSSQNQKKNRSPSVDETFGG